MTTDTLMTDGQNDQAAEQEQASAAPTGIHQTNGGQEAQQQQTTEGQQAEGAKPEGEQEKPQGAPEKYEFKAPEGREFDPNVIEQFSEVARELNLSQEAAQKVIDKIAPALAAKHEAAIQKARSDWANSSKKDKEFGGSIFDESMAVAKRALDSFGTPELKTLLNESGLGNHPEIIRAFYRAGKSISEDKFVAGTGVSSPTEAHAKSLYPNSNLK